MHTNRNTAQTGVPQLRLRTNLKSGATTGGGYVGGVWYPDMSGYCSTGTVPPTTPTTPPPTTSGGYVGGVWYPDMSGYCAV